MRIVITFTFFLILFSCKKEQIVEKIFKETPLEKISGSDSIIVREVNSSEPVSLGNQPFRITISLWRNLMPGPEMSHPLISNIQLTEADSLPIQDDLKMLRLTLSNGNETWVGSFDEIRKSQTYQLEGISRNGPFWDAHAEVDVLCELKNESTGKIYKLIAKKQIIGAAF